MAKQEFIGEICSIPVTNRSELFSSADIHEKIAFMSNPVPQEHSSKLRWQRLHIRFKILPYQSIKVLYLRIKDASMPDKRVLSIDEMYDVLLRTHLEKNHVRRIGLYKRLSQEFHGITEKACNIFLQGCEECHLRKAKKSIKSLVVKPISSSRFLSRCQVDLIDFRDMSEEHNKSEAGNPFHWLLVYQDHFTKFIRLRPLKTKCAKEVADVLEDIFCELGIPHILQSDNGREFKNDILFTLVNEHRPDTKIIHGKPRHLESQGSVERANRDIKNALASKMRDNSNDLCWVKYVRHVQLEKNTTYHSTIGMTPFEALYNHKPSFGLSDLGIPNELASEIHDEEDLERVINEINNPPNSETPISNELPSAPDKLPSCDIIGQTDLTPIHEVELPFQQPSIQDVYLDDISQPLPEGIQVFSSQIPTSSTAGDLNCIKCGLETSGEHKCYRCRRPIHFICCRPGGEEGNGSSVWCPRCDIEKKREQHEAVRIGLKRKQDILHQRMISSSAKKFAPAHVGDNVTIPIERPDKMNSLGQQNVLGVVTGVSEDVYTIGTTYGTLDSSYTRNQFGLCTSNRFLQPSEIPETTLSQTTVMRNSSLGIVEGSFCRCLNCKTNRCACRKSNRTCNTKCHLGRKCFNK